MSFDLIHDDCINLSDHLTSKKFDLIYLDPPFGTGNTQTLRQFSYADGVTGKDYLSFLGPRLKKIKRALKSDGILLVHLDKYQVYEVKNFLDDMGLQFKGDIIWAYRRWSSNIEALQNNHDTVLVFSNSDRITIERRIISNSIVAPSSRERVGYPTQKPVELLRRIFSIFCDRQSINSLLDPFMGSGSSLVAGKIAGIPYVCGLDISKDAIKIAGKRLRTIRKDQHEFSL